ncbi:hypothetical protein I6F36_24330 [Bradyrhizobium sp. BRP19]|uniref:hypothetical protein n=1 Tax=Bradyrhizobium sp. BRP19 TaxID=2793823 RepID=UPI001CD470C8|nr:hypothetical protein [Bradyrhizobium sp. BRP19]MCA1549963.1 hypothetical protein [Bradyrhizobium sp. BRP19]
MDEPDLGGEFGDLFPEKLFFKTPLYDALPLTEHGLDQLFDDELRLDGFCSRCGERRTFRKSAGRLPLDFSFPTSSATGEFAIRCTRFNSHRVVFYYLIEKEAIQKIGQFPSFADIAIDESKDYSKLLNRADRAEFHKAIGLASHGVGIGAFVYLRRIFERLIQSRFFEYKDLEGWDETAFRAARMGDKIEMLKDHLPQFLVENRRIYSIVSLGVHQLSENECLKFFPILKASTIFILEEDMQKKQRLAEESRVRRAIAEFKPPKEEEEPDAP